MPRGHRTASVLFYQASERREPGDCGSHQPARDHQAKSDLESMQEDLFGNRGRQKWGSDWSTSLRSLQKIPSGSQDRKTLSNPQHFSVRSGDLY